MSNRKNPRRIVLRALRDINAGMRLLVTRWDVDGKVWGERGLIRTRRPGEYPENNAKEWLLLIADVSELTMQLDKLRTYAEGELARVEAADA